MIFIDDREQCVAGAQQVSMKALLFNDTAQIISEVQACLDASASSEPSKS
ncbi:MAG TPA: hypothetical protein VKB35_01380 [Ktedonobacteraceae bacterium]|nr:hypothetical protein [Ktedonobacteraceae bacterium]